MTYHRSLLATGPSHHAQIAVLRCREDFEIDPMPLQALLSAQTADAAEATICRALEDIAVRLDLLQKARIDGRYVEIGKPARRIACVAGGLGLVSVRRVADDVANAALSGAGVALSATLSRLERCFDRAVSDVWQHKLSS